MKVRRAIIKDLKRVQDLYGIVSDEMAGTIYDIMWRRDIYPSKKEIVKDIRHHELYVLVKDNKIIGAMVLNHEYDECYNKLSWQIFADDDEVLILHRLCIHPQYRGCGKFLIKQAIEIAKFLNQKAIRLDVLCTNKPAIYLYEKYGFLLQGYQTMDYGEPVVAGLYESSDVFEYLNLITALLLTIVPLGTDLIIKVLPPITEPSPTTVSPPNTLALE